MTQEHVEKFTAVFHAETKRMAEKILEDLRKEHRNTCDWVKISDYIGRNLSGQPEEKFRVVCKYQRVYTKQVN